MTAKYVMNMHLLTMGARLFNYDYHQRDRILHTAYDSTFTTRKTQDMDVIRLTEVGEKLGYNGESLRQFVENETKKAAEKERQQMEREDRALEREERAKVEEHKRELEKKEIERQQAEEDHKRDFEKRERETTSRRGAQKRSTKEA